MSLEGSCHGAWGPPQVLVEGGSEKIPTQLLQGLVASLLHWREGAMRSPFLPLHRKPRARGCRGNPLIRESSCVFSLNSKSVRMEISHKRCYKSGQKTLDWWINTSFGAKTPSPALGPSLTRITRNTSISPGGLREGPSLLQWSNTTLKSTWMAAHTRDDAP